MLEKLGIFSYVYRSVEASLLLTVHILCSFFHWVVAFPLLIYIYFCFGILVLSWLKMSCRYVHVAAPLVEVVTMEAWVWSWGRRGRVSFSFGCGLGYAGACKSILFLSLLILTRGYPSIDFEREWKG